MLPANLSLPDNETSRFGSHEESSIHGAFLIAGKCAVCFIICFTVFGDLLVYAAFYVNSSLRTSTNAFFLSLVTSDILLALFVMPLDILRLSYHPFWPFGVTVCNVWNSTSVALGTATICNLCSVGIERCLAISRPLRHNDEISGGVIVSLVFLWTFALMNGIGSFFIWEQFDRSVCVELPAPLRSSVPLLVVNILLPFGICILTYGKIYHISRRQARRIIATSSWFSKGGRSFAREKRSAKTLSLLVGVFAVCFMPFFVFHLLHSLYKNDVKNEFYVSNIVKWLAYLGPATNWALYGFLNREFRGTFIKIFDALGVRTQLCSLQKRNEVGAEAYVIS